MGKMMLILVVSLGAILGITSFNMMQANTGMTLNAVTEYARIQAKSLAESGVEYAVMRLAQDTSWCAQTTLDASGGQMDVRLENTYRRYPDGPNVGEKGKLVTSVGRFNNEAVTIRAIIQIPFTADVPPWMRYALLSDEDLSLGGSVDISDDGNANWNSDVHTNSDLSANGSILVKGFGSYKGSISLRPNNPGRFFKPNVNPASAPVTSQVAQIDVPVFDPSAYIAAATQVFLGSSTTVTAHDLALGTADNPQIVYVEGDLFLSGRFSGYGVYIVMGDIHITGNVDLNSVDPLGNNLGFYSAKRVYIHGNASASGQIFAQDDIVCGGNNTIHGLAITKGSMQFQGSVDLYYRPALPNLTTPFWPGDVKRPQIVSYYQ